MYVSDNSERLQKEERNHIFYIQEHFSSSVARQVYHHHEAF